MARHPPTIVSVVGGDGGISVEWEVDTFFADSEPGEKVLVDLNGLQFAELDGDETSAEIPAATVQALGTPDVVVSVSFWWDGDPPHEQQSSVRVPVGGGGTLGGNPGVFPAARPVVTVVRVEPKTLTHPNRITIAWRSNNYNDGNIVWGPETQPAAHGHSIRPRGENYSGQYTTDRPLAPGTPHVFMVEVRNTLHSPTWLRTTAVVRSARNFGSLRSFLQASGTPVPGGVNGRLGPVRSIRATLGL